MMMYRKKGSAPHGRKKQFLSLGLALGALVLLILVMIGYESLPYTSEARPPLAFVAGTLTLAFLLSLSFWFAGRPSRPAHAAAVLLRIFYGLILFALAWQIFRDIEIRAVTGDTWVYAAMLAAGIAAFNVKKILSALRLRAFRRRANHVTTGRICQVVGETHFDIDWDASTLYNVLIEYEVDHTLYRTIGEIALSAIKKFGRDAFIGRSVPVFYDPADPAASFVNPIDKRFFSSSEAYSA